MAEKRSGFLRRCRKYPCVMLLALIGMAVVFVAKDKKPQAASVPARAEVRGRMAQGSNPLTKCEDAEISLAVLKYYKRMSEHKDYVEHYEDFHIYLKSGQFEKTYIVFATYKMKIRDIYTPVPGLGTLYVEKAENGGVSIRAKVEDPVTQRVIAKITEHEDVRRLFGEVEASYREAVQSDVMLAEALGDLQEAAQNEEQSE